MSRPVRGLENSVILFVCEGVRTDRPSDTEGKDLPGRGHPPSGRHV